MIMTVEYDASDSTVEIFTDCAGLDMLIDLLRDLRSDTYHAHEHLETPTRTNYTPPFAGRQLTEIRQNTRNELVQQVTIYFQPDNPDMLVTGNTVGGAA